MLGFSPMTRLVRLFLLALIVLSQHAGLVALLADDACCGEQSQACGDDCSANDCALRSCCAERAAATPPADLPRMASPKPTAAHLPEVERLTAAEPSDILHVPKSSRS